MVHSPGINENDKLLAVTTLSFDISVLEIFLPLSKGATVVVASASDITDGAALIDLIEKHHITFLQATPSLWNFMLASGWKGNKKLKGICGGETLSSRLVSQIISKVREFWNFYGPTETTVWSTGMKISDSNSPILIGKPINNTNIYILDNNNKLLPVGATGEICIGGFGVAKGYFKNSELTAQKFIQFEDIGIIYRTGDLGRFHEDGNIEFLGRIDNQIKYKGYRIEPGEIESIFTRLEGVREAVVKLHKFDADDERLVAFLNVDSEFKMTNKEIIDFLAMKLPQYMIPRVFQKSDGFPRMPNGKINKKAFFFETYIPDQKEKEATIKLSSTEEVIFNIWCEALKIKNISATDNFFEIGGNSLLALSVFSKIEAAFNIEMGLRVFFDSPRIIDLAQKIDIILQKQIENKGGERNHQSKLNIIKGNI